MATKVVEITGLGQVTLSKRRDSRSLRISLSPSGEIKVSLPYWLPYAVGVKFAHDRSSWIREHRPAAKGYLKDGQSIGKAHRLSIIATSTDKVTARLKPNLVEVIHPKTNSSNDPEVQKQAKNASVRALRKEALALLPQRLQQLASQSGFSYADLSIKLLKSRWGSCSSDKKITLNLFLMQLPWHLIDYVILHELTHTKVMQHGEPFWSELQKHSPSAKALRKEIKHHHPSIKTLEFDSET